MEPTNARDGYCFTYAMKDIDKIKEQLEIIKVKVRANGKNY